MSTTIDQRVVEMQFDNKHFERNVSTTMSTLDKLKQKLHLDGATKGLESVNTAAKNVNMSPLGSAVETVQAKFSALQVMGVTALANITNSAVNAGKRIVSALTIDPVKTGFQEYETQINAVQTILANTESKGTTINDVNKALEQLNTYADKTIYNFTEMTRNIGTFTAAGVDLDTSVNAIQGIANLAAVSGSTSQQASTAMYQLSQALAAGTVKLMDWNSVVNAGMGGQVFQDALKETARVHGIAIDDMIKEQGSFRETLSEGWITSEILTETLQKFTLTTEGLTDEQIKANREMLKTKGYTDEQIEGIFKLGNTATNAATKVKTFTQLWDVLKESAQSGWSQTWKILIGDFEEAKNLLSPLADTLTGFINKFSKSRNDVLESAFGSNWDKLVKKINEAGIETETFEKKIKEGLKNAGYDVDELISKYGSLEKVFQSGKFSTKILTDALASLGISTGKLKEKLFDLTGIDRLLGWGAVGDDVKKVQTALEALGHTLDIFGVDGIIGPETTGAIKEFQKLAGIRVDGIVGPETLAALEKVNIKASELTAENKDLAESYDELVAAIHKKSGKELLVETLKNTGSGLIGVFKALGDAWRDIFPPKTSEQKAAALYKLLSALHEFSQKLIMDKDTADKLTRTLKGLFAIIDIIMTVVGGPLKIVFKMVTGLLKALDIPILDVTASIGDALVAFNNWLDSVLDFEKIFRSLFAFLKESPKYVKNWFTSFKQSKIVQAMLPLLNAAKTQILSLVDAVKKTTIFKTISSYFKPAIDSIKKWIDGLKEADNIPKYIFDGLINGLKNGASRLWSGISNVIVGMIEAVKDILGIHSPSTVFMAIGGFVIAGLVKGIIEGLPDIDGAMGDVVDTLKNIVSKIDLGAIFSALTTAGLVTGFNKIADLFKGVGDLASGAGETLSGVGTFLAKTASGVNKVLKKSAGGIKKILNNTAKVIQSFSKVLDGVAFSIKADAIKNLGITLLMLVGAVVVLTFFKPAELWNAVGIIVALAAILTALAWAITKINTASASFSFKDGISVQNLTSGLLGIGVAVLLLGMTVKMIGSLNADQAKQGFLGLAGIVVAIIAVVGLFGLMGKNSSAGNIDKLGKMLQKMAVAILIMAVVVKLLGGMDRDQYGQGTEAVIGFAGVIAGLMLATKLISGSKNVESIGSTLIKIALAIGVMAIVAKMLGEMDPNVIIQGGIAIVAFGGIIVGLMAATKLITGSKHVDTIGSTLLKMALAIGVMAIVAKMLGEMDPYALIRGGLAIVAFGGIIVGLMAATKLISGSKNIEKIGGAILAISGAIAIMALTALMLSMMSWEGFAKGVTMITAFGGIIVGLMAATKLISGSKNVDKIGNTLLSIAGAIAILALVAVLLGLVPIDILKRGTIIITVLSAVMAGLIAVTNLAKNCMGNIISLTVAVAVIAAAAYLLSTVDPAGLITATVAISVLLGMFALMLTATRKVQNALGTIIAMAAAVAVIGVVLHMLASDVYGNDVLASAVALSILMGVLTGVIIVLSKIKVDIKNAALGALALLAMAVPLLAFVGVLALMQGVKNAMTNVLALSLLVGTMTLLLIPLTLVGMFAVQALLGVLALTAMAIPMLVFVGVIALMQNISNATANVDLLLGLMTTMTDLLVRLAIVAPLALLGVAAIAALTGVMLAVGALAVAIGALMTQFPAIQEFLNTGLPVLEQLAGSIGTMIGNFVAGMIGSIADALPDLGMKLSLFMINATPFIVGAKMVDSSVLAGAGYLAGAVLALTVADLIDGISSFIQGGSSFADLGKKLSDFMIAALPFITCARMIDASAMEGVKTLVATLLLLTGAELLESITSWITGESSISSFAEQLVPFGEAIAEFSSAVAGKVDEGAVKAAANAGKALAEMASSIPTSGGLWQMLAGEQSISDFAAGIADFGEGIKDFADNIKGLDLSNVTPAVEAGKALADMASSIPTSGGLWQLLAGENNISQFASGIADFGQGIKDFADKVTSVDANNLTPIIDSGKALADMASNIPTSGGLWQLLAGENSISKFADGIADFGEGVKDFADQVKDVKPDSLTPIIAIGQKLAEMASSIPTEGGLWQAITGSMDLETFGEQVGAFGGSLSAFFEKVKGISSTDAWAGRDAAIALTEIPNPHNVIHSFAIVPEGDLTAFKSNLYTFGQAVCNYSSHVSGMNIEAIRTATSGISYLSSSAFKIPGIVNPVCNIGYNLSSFDYYLKTFATAIKNYSLEVVGIDCAAVSSSASAFEEIANMVRRLSGIKFDGVTSFANSLGKIGESGVDAFVETFNNASDRVNTAGSDMISNLIDGAESKSNTIKTAFSSVVESAVTAIRSKYTSFSRAGSYLVSGFASGISTNSYKAAAQARAMAKAAADAAEDELDINSPSKVFREIGTSVPEGFAMGIDKLTGLVTGSSTAMGQAAIDNVKSAISRITDAVNSDIDTQPTIRPVLDLTNVRAGASTLGSLLNTDSSVGVVANVGRISGMMSGYSQNGVNDDVVSAIGKLRKDLSNMDRVSYNINGINVSEGTDAAEAIHALVRVIKMEGRS